MHSIYDIVRMGSVLLLRMASGFLIFVVLARLLGVEQFGRFTYWIAISGLLMLIVNFGFNLSLLREIPQNRNQADVLLVRALACKLMLAIPATVGCAFILGVRESDWPFAIAIFLIYSAEFIFSVAETANTALRALGKYGYEARLAFSTNLIHVGVVVTAAFYFKDLTMIAAAYCFSRLIYVVLTFLLFRRVWGKKIIVTWNIRKQIETLRSTVVYATDAALTNLYDKVDVVLLESFLGLHAVGVYQAGSKLYKTALGFSSAIGNVYIPRLASTKDKPSQFRRAYVEFALMMSFYGGFCALFLTFLSDPITHWMFGSEYNELVMLFPYFGLIIFLRCLAATGGGILTVLGHQKFRVFVNTVSISVLICASYILIPRFSIKGLLGGLLLSNLVILLLYYFFIIRKYLLSRK